MSQIDHEKKLLPAEDGCTSIDDGGVITEEPPCDSQVVQIPPVVMKRFEPELEVEAKDYFWLSLFTLLCCSCPIGLIALLKTREVRRYNKAGEYDHAWKSSKTARFFVRLGIFVGILQISIVILNTFTSNIGTILRLSHPAVNGTNATVWD